jgi:hypothetical protein
VQNTEKEKENKKQVGRDKLTRFFSLIEWLRSKFYQQKDSISRHTVFT